MFRRFIQLAWWTVLIKLYLYLDVQVYPESCQTSKMEHFAKIEHFAVYYFWKTLHIRQGSKYVSEICTNVTMPSLKNKTITACNRFSRIYLCHLLNRRVVDRSYCLAIVVKNIFLPPANPHAVVYWFIWESCESLLWWKWGSIPVQDLTLVFSFFLILSTSPGDRFWRCLSKESSETF